MDDQDGVKFKINLAAKEALAWPNTTNLIDDFVVSVSSKYGQLVEERIRLKIAPKPKWMPSGLYKKIIKSLFLIEIQK